MLVLTLIFGVISLHLKSYYAIEWYFNVMVILLKGICGAICIDFLALSFLIYPAQYKSITYN